MTRYPDGQVSGAFWSADSQGIYFARTGDLWRVSVQGGEPRAVWTTPETESSITPVPDGSRVAFVRSARGAVTSTIVVRSLVDGKEARVAGELAGAGGLSWSPDGAQLAFTVARTIRHDETPAYSGAKIIYTITERTPSQAYVVKATGGSATAIGPPGGFFGLRWSGPSHVVFDRTSVDFKRRTIYEADDPERRAAPRRRRREVLESDRRCRRLRSGRPMGSSWPS